MYSLLDFVNLLIIISFRLSVDEATLKVDLHSIRFSSAFVRFCTFFLLHEKVCSFFVCIIIMSIRANQTDKSFPKVFFEKIQLCFEISLSSYILEIFEPNFYQYVTVYFVWLWTYKNAHEKSAFCH